MAIIIPSKNIYEQPTSDKILSNRISSIDISTKVVIPQYHYNSHVYDGSFPQLNNDYKTNRYDISTLTRLSTSDSNRVGTTALRVDHVYTKFNDIVVPKVSRTRTIFNLGTSKYPSEEEYVKYTLSGGQKTTSKGVAHNVGQIAGTDFWFNSNIINKVNFEELSTESISTIEYGGDVNFNTTSPFNGVYPIWGEPTITKSSGNTFNVDLLVNRSLVSFKQLNESDFPIVNDNIHTPITINDKTYTFEIVDDKDNNNFIIKNLVILTSTRTYAMAVAFDKTQQDTTSNTNYYDYQVIKQDMTFTNISLTILGDRVDLSIEDGKETLGEGGNKYSVSSNELLQSTNYISYSSVSFYSNSFDRIREQFKKGKEVSSILCSISDYYDSNNSKKISINSDRMTFQEHDIVMPMVYTNKGDVPMSLNQDGSAKEFQVVQVEMVYDGAVWQKLTLQEYVNKVNKE